MIATHYHSSFCDVSVNPVHFFLDEGFLKNLGKDCVLFLESDLKTGNLEYCIISDSIRFQASYIFSFCLN